MEHQKIKILISSYFDGEANEVQTKTVLAHLETCAECQREYEEMGQFEEVMGQMKLKNPPQEVWKMYWTSVYNRIERGIGWILLSIGAMILLFYGGYKIVEGLIQDAATPLLLKIGILACLAGIAVLAASLLREQLFVRKRERYKEVEK